MPVANQISTIPLSASVSGSIDIGNARLVTIHVPVVTSCVMTLNSAFDTSSENYFPLHASNGSAWSFACGGGSKAIILNEDIIGGSRYLKIGTSIAQAAVRSLTVTVRL